MTSPQSIYLHDGSFEGLLSAVAVAVKARQPVKGIFPRNNSTVWLFDRVVHVAADQLQAEKLLNYLKSLGGEACRLFMHAYLGEDREVGMHLYRMVRLCLHHGAKATELHSDDSIRYLSMLSRRVGCEAHRLYGLIRFRMLKDNLLYAPFSSDCNVIGYLAGHFSKRMRNNEWILHDVGRNIALHWDGLQLQQIEVDQDFAEHVRRHGEVPVEHYTDDEHYYQQLWRSFHAAIANPDRENRKLQRQLMPRRYWQYLVEMHEQPDRNGEP